MREIRSYGSVRGVAGDRYPYRDSQETQAQPQPAADAPSKPAEIASKTPPPAVHRPVQPPFSTKTQPNSAAEAPKPPFVTLEAPTQPRKKAA